MAYFSSILYFAFLALTLSSSLAYDTKESFSNQNDNTHDQRELSWTVINAYPNNIETRKGLKTTKDGNNALRSSTFTGGNSNNKVPSNFASNRPTRRTQKRPRTPSLIRPSPPNRDSTNKRKKVPSRPTRSNFASTGSNPTRNKQTKATGKDGKCQLCIGQEHLPNDSLYILDQPCSYWHNRDIDSSHCRQIQSTYGSACGCPNSPKPRCNVCPDDDYVWKQNSEYNGFVDDYCVRMVHKLSREAETHCDGAKDKVASMCCMSTCSANTKKGNQTDKSARTKANAGKTPKGLRAEMIELKNARTDSKTKSKKANAMLLKPNTKPSNQANTNNAKSTKSKTFFFKSKSDDGAEESFTIPNDNDVTGGGEVYYYYDDI